MLIQCTQKSIIEEFGSIKRCFENITLISRMEEVSKKRAAYLLVEAGFKYYIGAKVKQHINAEIAAKEAGQDPVITRAIMELIRFCRKRGMDIRKLI